MEISKSLAIALLVHARDEKHNDLGLGFCRKLWKIFALVASGLPAIKKMKELGKIFFENRASFRSWLEANHDKSPGIWMIFYKKHTNKDYIPYKDALEEALCFGWIDSTSKKIDDEIYLRKFLPRTNTSNWSDINKKLALSLIEKGKMTEAGLRKIDVYLKTGKVDWEVKSQGEKKKNELDIPDLILKELARSEPALTNFDKLAPSYKRNYIQWITSAKREETILKRLKEAIELLKENKKLWLK